MKSFDSGGQERRDEAKIRAQSLERARQELPEVLTLIRKSRRGNVSGHRFSFMGPTAKIVAGHPERDFDPVIMVQELMRLVTRETQLACTFEDQGPFQSGFSVDF